MFSNLLKFLKTKTKKNKNNRIEILHERQQERINVKSETAMFHSNNSPLGCEGSSSLKNGKQELQRHVVKTGDKNPLFELFSKEEFISFISALEKQGIYTIEQLKDINLFSFLNDNNISYGSMRFILLDEIVDKIKDYNSAFANDGNMVELDNKSAKKESNDISKIIENEKNKYDKETSPDSFTICPLGNEDLKALNKDSPPEEQQIAKRVGDVSLLELFSHEMFKDFVSALKEQDINTIEQLKNISLYSFLYLNEISSGKDRVTLYNHIKRKINEIYTERPLSEQENIKISVEDEKPFKKPEEAFETIAEKGEFDITKQVEAYVKGQSLSAVSTETIKDELGTGRRWGIKKLICNLPCCVEIESGKFIHRDNITDLDSAAEIILQKLRGLFVKGSGYASSKQLFDSVRTNLDMFMFENDFESEGKIFSIAQHLFSKEKYKGNHFLFYYQFHIWEKEPDYPKSLTGILIKFARENGGIITKDECEEYLKKLGVATVNVPATMRIWQDSIFWQIDGNKYILSEIMGINKHFEQSIKKSLVALIDGYDYVIIQDIADNFFDMLPPLPKGEKWTALLLQEAIKNLETDFQTIPAGYGQSVDTVHTAITRNNSGFTTFADVVWDYVNRTLDTPIQIETERLRQELIAAGMLKGSERLTTMHKALDDYRFIWLDDNKAVNVTKG